MSQQQRRRQRFHLRSFTTKTLLLVTCCAVGLCCTRDALEAFHLMTSSPSVAALDDNDIPNLYHHDLENNGPGGQKGRELQGLERSQAGVALPVNNNNNTITGQEYVANNNKNSTENHPVVLFYHVYVGPTPEQVNISYHIVKEQLLQVVDALSLQPNVVGKPWKLVFNTVGKKFSKVRQKIHDTCQEFKTDLNCHFQRHHDTAYEEVTLTDLHRHCQANPMDRVVYLHNKGSYHPTSKSDEWRRGLTEAATRQACLEDINNGDCNICGEDFYILWTPMFAGNMWMADCQYIQKLLPPVEYAQQVAELKENEIRRQGIWSYLYWNTHSVQEKAGGRNQDDDFLGIGRYASEHWLGSHPDILPCEPNDSEFPFEPLGPNWIMNVPNGQKDKFALVMMNDQLRLNEYCFLPGLLLRWFALYNAIPSLTSWVWKFFPDADLWQEWANKYKSYQQQSSIDDANNPKNVSFHDYLFANAPQSEIPRPRQTLPGDEIWKDVW